MDLRPPSRIPLLLTYEEDDTKHTYTVHKSKTTKRKKNNATTGRDDDGDLLISSNYSLYIQVERILRLSFLVSSFLDVYTDRSNYALRLRNQIFASKRTNIIKNN